MFIYDEASAEVKKNFAELVHRLIVTHKKLTVFSSQHAELDQVLVGSAKRCTRTTKIEQKLAFCQEDAPRPYTQSLASSVLQSKRLAGLAGSF